MIDRRSQILTKGHDIDVVFPHIVHGLFDFIIGFTQAQHEARFG